MGWDEIEEEGEGEGRVILKSQKFA